MLSRLRISQRLSLLLVVPVGAAVVIGVPAIVDRVDQSRAAAAVAGSLADARVVAGLIQELQQERLLSVAYLASPSVQRSTLISQRSSTQDAITLARAALAGPTAAELRDELDKLGELAGHSTAVLAGRASPDGLWSAYSRGIAGLIEALHLTDQPDADAAGVRQTQALDALLRANEQASQANGSLLLADVDPAFAAPVAARAQLLRTTLQDRFGELATPALAALLDRAVTGPSSVQADRLLADVAQERPIEATPQARLSLAEHDADLRRLVQTHVERAITEGAADRAAGAWLGAVVIAAVTAGVLLAIVLLGFAVTRSVSRPLRRVTVAATAIADLASREMARTSRADETDDRPPRLAALTLRSADEIGELASAFNRVQATAALLMEQQVTSRRNVATMFGNIAHRTQSLVSRQLQQIDELERNERDEQRLASLYRLDHLTARLRRSADSLLVIAGARDDARQSAPQPLADVVRSAMAEVEGYQNVALRHLDRVVLTAAVVPDLTLLLAELLENATSFSPPGVAVEVSSVRSGGGELVIRVVDHGMGMTPQRLEEENRRLVSAERLDVAPTTMLGLFVVGRIARRHGLDVRLSATPVTGITAEVSIPPSLLLPEQPAVEERPPARPVPPTGPSRFVEPDRAGAGSWFDPAAAARGPAPQTHVNGSAPPLRDSPRGGLRRREPGRSLSSDLWPTVSTASVPRPAGPSIADPEAERAALDAFAQGAARAEAQGAADPGPWRATTTGTWGTAAPGAGPADAARHGLRRRQPGAQLGPDIRPAPGRHRPPEERWSPAIDAEAERRQMQAYLDGNARAEEPGQYREPPSQPTWQSRTDPWSR